MYEDDEQEMSFLRRHPIAVAVGALILFAGAGVGAKSFLTPPRTSSREQTVTLITLTPQVTPPPVKPVATPPPAIHPTPAPLYVDRPTYVSGAPVKPSHPDTPAPLTTTIHGPNGTDGLAPSGPGIGGAGTGIDSGSGNKFGAFADEVQSRIAQALQADPRTRTAAMKLTVRIWPDSTGRVTKARIAPGTGDVSLDALIQNQILTGMQLTSAPPADMPVPIVMNVTAQRP
jgi:protein TonB